MSTRLFPVFLVLLLAGAAATQDKAVWRVWEGEKKLIVVTTPDWDATHGTLTRFERRDHEWIKVSEPIPVVVGRTGLGWDPALNARERGAISRSDQARR